VRSGGKIAGDVQVTGKQVTWVIRKAGDKQVTGITCDQDGWVDGHVMGKA